MRSETEGVGVDEQETAPSEETEATVAERRAIAEALSNEVGYRSAEYLGDGKFRVDYAISGRLDRGFVYPVNVDAERSEEHTSELQSLMRRSYAVFCLNKKTNTTHRPRNPHNTSTKY